MKPEDRPQMRRLAAVQAWDAFCREPLALLPAYQARMATNVLTGMPLTFGLPEAAAAKASGARPAGAIGVVPIQGVLTKGDGGLCAAMFGGTSYEAIARTVREYAASPAVGAIVLDVHSPGGSAFGISEAFAAIGAAGQKKRVVAVVNCMAGSGAYWLAAAAHEIVIEPLGIAGGIGVRMSHIDESEAMEDAGLTETVIYAGRLKADGVAGPLSDEGVARIQSIVDGMYDQFVDAVATGRGVARERVINDFGEGMEMGAKEAVRVGLADRIGSLDDVLAELGGSTKAAARRRAQVRAESLEL